MAYSSILVLGGSGFIGSHLVASLAARGCSVVVPTRHVNHTRSLWVLPTVDVVEADIHDDAALNSLVSRADAVVNLVGILHSRPASENKAYGPDFERVHVELPRRIVAACAAQGVVRYLHMSALGARRDAPSMYLRSKAEGEAVVHSQPAVASTIFRPSVVFGEEDHFLNLFAHMQKWLPLLPLAGSDAKFQPVYVGDVVAAFEAALGNKFTAGKTYELVGPEVYTLRELARMAGEYAGHRRLVFGLPDGAARLQAWIFEHLPGEPLISRDNLDSMKIDSIGAFPPPPELGITPIALETVAPAYLG